MATGQAMTDNEKAAQPAGKTTREAGTPARVPLDAILKGAREIIIVHNGDDYRLRVTARGKLILTK